MREKVRWTKANRYGGLMLYDFYFGMVPSAPAGQRLPLVKATVDEIGHKRSDSSPAMDRK
jgi:hypothetical protein